MKVTVKLFAILRERAGVPGVDLQLPAGSTVDAAVQALLALYPALAEHASKSAVAINRDYGRRDTVLRDGDELAVIPPVSGG